MFYQSLTAGDVVLIVLVLVVVWLAVKAHGRQRSPDKGWAHPFTPEEVANQPPTGVPVRVGRLRSQDNGPDTD